jgi:hypothetical protein
MHRRNTLLASLVSIGLLGGCTWSPETNINGGGQAGGAGHLGGGGPGGKGVIVDGSGQPTSDANCGITKIPTTKQPADVLYVQDKSGSMDQDPTGGNCNGMAGCSKWDQMTPPINQTVMATQADVRWGLKFFPDPNTMACAVNNTVQVPVALNNATPIANAIAAVGPGGSTPTRVAINNAVTYLNGNGDTNPKYILLATDGLPNCAPGGGNTQNSDANGAVTAIANALTAGIPTFVVGIGNTGAAATLTMMAQAGGRPTAAAPFYYQVNSGADLVAALSAISGSVRSCTFSLSSKPPDPTNVKVQADGVTVPPSATDGWGFNPGITAVILTGSYCQNVLNGTTKDVEVLFGCGINNIP